MKKLNYFLFAAMLPSFFALSGCHGSNGKAKKEVTDFIKRAERASQAQKNKSKEKQKIVTSYVFEANKGRNPFEMVDTVAAKNKKSFSDTVLPNVSVDNVQLVGTVVRAENSWAIVRVGDGKLYRITKGIHLGVQQAKVSDIVQGKVVLQVETESNEKEKTSDVVLRMQE